MSLELDKQPATLTWVKPRSSKRDEQITMEVRLRFEMSNDVLATFGSQLRDSLFWRGNGSGQQVELDGVQVKSDAPALRNECIVPPIALSWEGYGYEVVVDYGIGSKIVLGLAELSKVKLTPKDGGTVTWAMRVRSTKVSERDKGLLCELLNRDVTINVIPPRAQEQAAIDEKPAKASKGGRRKKADAEAAAPKGAKPGTEGWPFPGSSSAGAASADAVQ